MIRRYVPSKLVDYIWDDQNECASLAFGDECEPGEAAEYEHRPQPLKLRGYCLYNQDGSPDHEMLRAGYFDNLRRWIAAERKRQHDEEDNAR